jgi:hypothetical protein
MHKNHPDGTVFREFGGNRYVKKDGKLYRLYDLDKYISKEPIEPTKTIEVDSELKSEPLPDIYTEGRKLFSHPLLNDYERIELNDIVKKIDGFKNIIRQTIIKRNSTYIGGIIISGKPGTGKTHNTVQWVNELISEGHLSDLATLSGKLTPNTLFGFMNQCDPGKVQILDDCDVFYNHESLNILKAGLNTRSSDPGFRDVTWGSRNSIKKFSYTSFMIMITNETFDKVTSDHLKAVLDRVHLFEIPLTSKDMFIFNSYLIEKTIHEDRNLSDLNRSMIREFYNTEIQDFIEYEVFKDADINFSIRFILKILDLFTLFYDDWKNYSKDYIKLKTIYDLKIKNLSTTN